MQNRNSPTPGTIYRSRWPTRP